MAKTDLEQTSEEGMISLVFLDVIFSGKSRYKRLDTGEILEGKVRILQENLGIMIDYSGEGTIKVKPAIPEAKGLLFPENPKPGELYRCNYCDVE